MHQHIHGRGVQPIWCLGLCQCRAQTQPMRLSLLRTTLRHRRRDLHATLSLHGALDAMHTQPQTQPHTTQTQPHTTHTQPHTTHTVDDLSERRRDHKSLCRAAVPATRCRSARRARVSFTQPVNTRHTVQGQHRSTVSGNVTRPTNSVAAAAQCLDDGANCSTSTTRTPTIRQGANNSTARLGVSRTMIARVTMQVRF